MAATGLRDLLHLTESGALKRRLDARNRRVLNWLLVLAAPPAAVGATVTATEGRYWAAAAWIPVLVIALGAVLLRRRPFLEAHGRKTVIAFLAGLTLASWPTLPADGVLYAFAGYVYPFLLLFLRLEASQYLLLAGLDLGVVAWNVFGPHGPQDTGARIGMTVGTVVFQAIVLWVAATVTRRRSSLFLDEWRREVARERESSRMRTELEDAREIQLSMLPVDPPSLDWLDFSTVSLPASEVGGDYFDYFHLSGQRLAVVIADVAGHGMASGMVLSGVRSGLHLLREELGNPVEVLAKLDRMLRETVAGRIFVTLQIAVLDAGLGRVTVANAGHPPLFLAARSGRVARMGGSSLPLGTRLEARFAEEVEPLSEGDALLLFSDGVPEVVDHHGEPFGEERLLEALRRGRPGASARHLRDSLLNDLARFKGDVEQRDDLTLVVLKVAGAGIGGVGR